jgi:CubicO group peptidase (beta-lactamase class C family)
MFRVLKNILRGIGFFLLGVFILLNLFIILSGRFYLYKGIRHTYLIGKTGPGIYDVDVFANATIHKAEKPFDFIRDKRLNELKLDKNDLDYMDNLETSAFLVFKGDTLLYERYALGHKPITVSNSFSAAKTVVALLIGMALDEGKIKSLDEPVGNYIPEFKGGKKGKITIRHLLMMASGLDWQESGSNPLSENAESYYGSNLYGLVTRQQVEQEPGKKFIYQSGNSQLLGFILERATGKSLGAYTQEKLWKPIGAGSDAYWSMDKENGSIKSFCCLYCTALDFAKIGKLILNYGNYNGKQLISRSYMEEMVTCPPLKTEEFVPNMRYALHIWTYEDSGEKINYCRGIKGQYIITIPAENLIIVRLGSKRNDNFVIEKEQLKNPAYYKEHVGKVGHPTDLFRYTAMGKKIAEQAKN